MTQKDSLSKDLPQNPGHGTCFWNFHFYSWSQDTYSESQHSCCGCWHSHDTCHSHTYSSSDPPLKFCVGQVFGFSLRQNNNYCRRTGVSRATYATRYGSNWLRCHQSPVRGLCSWQEGISNEGFHQNQYSIIIRKNPPLIQRKSSPSLFISPAKRWIWSSPDVFRKTNEHHWPASSLLWGWCHRALIPHCTALASRNSAWYIRMSKNKNSNYYLWRAL